jgi:hypothetical protein
MRLALFAAALAAAGCTATAPSPDPNSRMGGALSEEDQEFRRSIRQSKSAASDDPVARAGTPRNAIADLWSNKFTGGATFHRIEFPVQSQTEFATASP